MKPRRITSDLEYQRLKRRLVEFADELNREDPMLFPPELAPDWREAFRAGFKGQLAELEHALRLYEQGRATAVARRADTPAAETGAG